MQLPAVESLVTRERNPVGFLVPRTFFAFLWARHFRGSDAIRSGFGASVGHARTRGIPLANGLLFAFRRLASLDLTSSSSSLLAQVKRASLCWREKERSAYHYITPIVDVGSFINLAPTTQEPLSTKIAIPGLPWHVGLVCLCSR